MTKTTTEVTGAGPAENASNNVKMLNFLGVVVAFLIFVQKP